MALSSSSSGEPNPFEVMLKLLPLEIQLDAERVLRGFGITHNDDPLVQLMAALGLYAAYFEKIPLRITEAGETMAAHHVDALAALDARVHFLRALSVDLQKAADRLKTAPQEIVDKFPTVKIAEELRRQIDLTLKTLPITNFEVSTRQANTSMAAFVAKAEDIGTKIEKELVRLQTNTESIQRLAIPHVSWWRNGLLVLATMASTALIMWWFGIRPAQNQIDAVMFNQGFIGTRVVSGYFNDQPVIVIAKDNFKDANVDPVTGNLTVNLKK